MSEYTQLLRFRGHPVTPALFPLYILRDSFIVLGPCRFKSVYARYTNRASLRIAVIMGNCWWWGLAVFSDTNVALR